MHIFSTSQCVWTCRYEGIGKANAYPSIITSGDDPDFKLVFVFMVLLLEL